MGRRTDAACPCPIRRGERCEHPGQRHALQPLLRGFQEQKLSERAPQPPLGPGERRGLSPERRPEFRTRRGTLRRAGRGSANRRGQAGLPRFGLRLVRSIHRPHEGKRHRVRRIPMDAQQGPLPSGASAGAERRPADLRGGLQRGLRHDRVQHRRILCPHHHRRRRPQRRQAARRKPDRRGGSMLSRQCGRRCLPHGNTQHAVQHPGRAP